jgi:hypothetical protein
MSGKLAPDFWSLVKKAGNDECWIWQGCVKPSGYGEYCQVGAHRVSYMRVNGYIPSEKHVHHTCNNKLCVNPKHLIALSAREHFLISPGGATGNNLRKTHCKNGHEFSEDNLYTPPGGGRSCKICRQEGVRFHRAVKLLNQNLKEIKNAPTHSK